MLRPGSGFGYPLGILPFCPPPSGERFAKYAPVEYGMAIGHEDEEERGQGLEEVVDKTAPTEK